MPNIARICRNIGLHWPPLAAERRERLFGVVRVLLGILLLAAGALKLYGVRVSAVPRLGWFAQPQVWVATGVWEFVLGFWLLSGAQRALSWLAATGTFLAFAGVSAYLGWSGAASCGCLGAVRVSPWMAFGIDVLALVLLWAARPPSPVETVPGARGALPIVLSSAAILAVLTGIGSWMYGSPGAALAHFRGESVGVDPTTTDVGAGLPGDSKAFRVQLRNYTDRTIRIVGGTSTCSCIATEGLPVSLPPKASASLDVAIKFGGPPGQFRHRFSFVSDDERHSKIVAYFSGRVLAPQVSPEREYSAASSP